MENEATNSTLTLVLKDQAGDYFLVPQAMLERCRVPEEYEPELERLLAEQADMRGYAYNGLTEAERNALNQYHYTMCVWTNLLGHYGFGVRPA